MHVRQDAGGVGMARRFEGGAVRGGCGASVGRHHRRLLGGRCERIIIVVYTYVITRTVVVVCFVQTVRVILLLATVLFVAWCP